MGQQKTTNARKGEANAHEKKAPPGQRGTHHQGFWGRGGPAKRGTDQRLQTETPSYEAITHPQSGII